MKTLTTLTHRCRRILCLGLLLGSLLLTTGGVVAHGGSAPLGSLNWGAPTSAVAGSVRYALSHSPVGAVDAFSTHCSGGMCIGSATTGAGSGR
jgi:hypothetical protein